MSELAEIAVIILKRLSDALLSAANEISKSKSSDSIIASSNREPVSLNVGVHIIFQLKRAFAMALLSIRLMAIALKWRTRLSVKSGLYLNLTC